MHHHGVFAALLLHYLLTTRASILISCRCASWRSFSFVIIVCKMDSNSFYPYLFKPRIFCHCLFSSDFMCWQSRFSSHSTFPFLSSASHASPNWILQSGKWCFAFSLFSSLSSFRCLHLEDFIWVSPRRTDWGVRHTSSTHSFRHLLQ